MFGILEKHTYKFHLFRISDYKHVLELQIPPFHQSEILGVIYFQQVKEILFIMKNKHIFSYFTTKKVFKRQIKFAECFLDFAYSESMKSLFCIGVSGKIYNIDMKMFYSQQWEQLTQAGLENWRMLSKPMQSFE